MSASLTSILTELQRCLGQPSPSTEFRLDADAIALSVQQRVAPLLYDSLGQVEGAAGGGDVAAIRTALQPSFYRSLLRNESLLQMADRVCAILHEQRIAAVRLKGADLLHSLYGNAALRPMDDVDILVDPEHARAAVRLLEKNGFHQTDNALPLDFYLEHHLHVALIEQASGGYLELHWQLLDPFKRAGLDGRFAVATAVPLVFGRPELGLRLRDDVRYLYLALHIDKHGPFHDVLLRRRGAAVALLHPSSEARLLWLFDLALQQSVKPVDPESVTELARSLAVERGVWTTLRLVEDLFGPTHVPNGLVAALAPADGSVLHRFACHVVGAILDSKSASVRRVLDWAMRMDAAAQFRPLRLLQLPLQLLAPGSAGLGRRRPRTVGPLQDLWRAVRLAFSLVRSHVQRWLGAGA